MMSSAYHIILTPFRAIVKPDDDYFVRSRKLMISSMLLLTPLCLIGSGAVGYQGFRYGFTPAVITAIVSLLTICFAFCVIPWYWVWRDSRHHWNDACMDAWLVSLLLVVDVIGAVLMTPSFCTVYFLCGFVSVVTRPKYRTYHLLSQFVSLLWFEYNVGVADPGITTLPLRVPGAIDALALYPILGLASLLWWLFVCVGLLSVINEYTSATEKATNSAALCYAVSEKLLSYDIQSAKKLLQEGGGEVDVRLRTALLQMVSNLELFRPHLPEYVWDIVRKRVLLDDLPEFSVSNNTAHTMEDAGSTKVPLQPLVLGPAAQREKSSSTTSSSSSTSPAAKNNGIRKGKPKDVVIVDSASEAIPSPALLQIVNSGPGGGVTRNNVDDVMPNFVPPTFTAGSLFEFLPETVNHVHYGMIDFTRRLTGEDILLGEDAIMPIDVVGADVASETTTPGPDSCLPRPASVRKLVNWAHSQALLSRGTLHSFVGDTIHATWCFRAPSAKPVVFLTKLYKTFNGDPSVGLNIGGVVVSGKGTSYMAGDRRQAYVLHIPWRDQVTQYFTIARENRAALICENTFSGSHKVINCRWIDVVPKLEGVMTSRSLAIQYSKVYEVLGLRGAGQDMSYDDVVASDVMAESSDDQQRRDSHDSFTTSNTSSSEETNVLMDAVSVSLEECVRGYYSDAKRYLGRDPRFLKGLSYSTMLDRLQRKIDKAMEDNVTGEMFCFV